MTWRHSRYSPGGYKLKLFFERWNGLSHSHFDVSSVFQLESFIPIQSKFRYNWLITSNYRVFQRYHLSTTIKRYSLWIHNVILVLERYQNLNDWSVGVLRPFCAWGGGGGRRIFCKQYGRKLRGRWWAETKRHQLTGDILRIVITHTKKINTSRECTHHNTSVTILLRPNSSTTHFMPITIKLFMSRHRVV